MVSEMRRDLKRKRPRGSPLWQIYLECGTFAISTRVEELFVKIRFKTQKISSQILQEIVCSFCMCPGIFSSVEKFATELESKDRDIGIRGDIFN